MTDPAACSKWFDLFYSWCSALRHAIAAVVVLHVVFGSVILCTIQKSNLGNRARTDNSAIDACVLPGAFWQTAVPHTQGTHHGWLFFTKWTLFLGRADTVCFQEDKATAKKQRADKLKAMLWSKQTPAYLEQYQMDRLIVWRYVFGALLRRSTMQHCCHEPCWSISDHCSKSSMVELPRPLVKKFRMQQKKSSAERYT
jgi:hypothetical protein